ncbi:NAD-dependent epimerase/dehydratase family protein [Paenibacillus xerothermodurans]|uniref:NAD(P)-dependent oxidoreductase n=1 Tax=Paenibacillus xerothermodurans TaxID=1977292 RepID=A0A2W1NBP8_PAEXE|nr:NAD(P)-dependent oxidoreductase [Paenibacillus xerothermodurans]PZE22089.1 NAD(P)-dependent oxidoreductase [Paenibacillus xerothermodurans]
MSRRLLVTGASGRIGKCLTEGLRGHGYEIIAADIKPDPELGVVELDIVNAGRLIELTEGVDTVLHFGWAKDDEDFLGKVLPINVTGAYNLYEAARHNGVKRVIFASSNHATGFYEVRDQVYPDEPCRPDSFYGLSKCYIELLGRLYADKYGVSSINIRIGNFSGDHHPHSERAAHIWISPRDMVHLAVCCIETDSRIDYLTLYGTSDNRDNDYNIHYLKEVIGYQPVDDAADLLAQAKLRNERIAQDETYYQGGAMVDKEQPVDR